jgi:hypothetical protein
MPGLCWLLHGAASHVAPAPAPTWQDGAVDAYLPTVVHKAQEAVHLVEELRHHKIATCVHLLAVPSTAAWAPENKTPGASANRAEPHLWVWPLRRCNGAQTPPRCMQVEHSGTQWNTVEQASSDSSPGLVSTIPVQADLLLEVRKGSAVVGGHCLRFIHDEVRVRLRIARNRNAKVIAVLAPAMPWPTTPVPRHPAPG